MRIPSAASTASLAPQSSALTVPLGDSFMVIFGAVSGKTVSGSPVTRSATKEDAENGTASQPESEQIEAQAPSVQSTTNIAVSAPVSTPVQSESVVDPESDNQEITNNSTTQSASIAIGQSWFAPSSGTIFHTPITIKEQAGQPAVSQSASKQVVVQTPLIQSNATTTPSEPVSAQNQSQLVAVATPDNRKNANPATTQSSQVVTRVSWRAISGETISPAQATVTKQAGQSPASKSDSSPKQSGLGANATPDTQEDSNPLTAPSTQVVNGMNWRAVSSGLSLQTPSTPVVTTAAVSTSPATPHIVWSASTFPASVTSIPQRVSASNSTASSTPDQAGEHVATRKVAAQQMVQSPSVSENYTLPATPVVPLPDQVTPSLAQKSAGQETVQSSSDLAPETSSKTSDFQVSPVAQNVPQTHLSEAASTTSAPERNATPLEQFAPAVQQDATANDQSAAPIVSSGTTDAIADPSAMTAGVMLPETLPLPVADPLPIVGSGSAAISNSLQRTTYDVAGSKSSDLTTGSNTVTSKTKAEAGSSDTASSHSAQSSQTDPSQGADPTPRITDNGASHLQTQTGVAQAVSHDAPIATRVATGSPDGSHVSDQHDLHTSSESESGASLQSPGINTTKLMQTMNETEMRIGMSSSDFGDISIRTTVSNHQMLAQISLDHSELSQALSAHVASVQTKLGEEYGLHASIEINNLGSSYSGEPGSSSQRENGTVAGSSLANNDAVPAEEESIPNLAAIAASGSDYRLDIRA